MNNVMFISCAEEGEGLPVFRKTFQMGQKPRSAALRVTALGCYIFFINGKRVGDFELEPGSEEMAKRKRYTEYDILPLLNEGENVLSAVVAGGWWSGRIADYGKREALWAQLTLTFENGEERVCTDLSWKSARKSAYRSGDIYDGDAYDARIQDDWKYVGFDDEKWQYVLQNTEFSGEIDPWRGPHITVKKELTRRASGYIYRGVTGAGENGYGKVNILRRFEDGFTLEAGETAVVDFGQNFSGRERFTVEGARGTAVTFRHGEVLNTDGGSFARNNDGAEGSVYFTNLRTAKAQTVYILSGNGREEYHPSFTYYGFRYMEITATAPVRFYALSGEVLSSVPRRTGWLKTSDKRLNRLVENAVWGQLSNYVPVPTDCPQRDERLGWTADTQVFAEAGCFLGDVKGFLEHWLVCLRDAQGEDGSFSGVAPTGQYHGSQYGGTGWADAGVLVPHILWQMYGDKSVIVENWDAMRRYVDGYLGGSGGLGGKPHWGDWLSYESNDDEIREILGVCYYAWDAKLMAEMAHVLQKEEESAHYGELYAREREFFRSRYIKEGKLVRGEQSVLAHAILLGLLEEEEEERAEKMLLENLAHNGNGLRTGFLGTKILLDVLTKIGHSDVAYAVLLNEDCPSWLYQVEHGATTVWERWNSYTAEDGFADKVMNSFNHYAYGCVVSWMFKTMAGIRPAEAGFEKILLSPEPSARVPVVEASYDSVRGKIEVFSKLDGGVWTYRMVIPAGASAILRLPAGAKNAVLDGRPISGESALSPGAHTLTATY